MQTRFNQTGSEKGKGAADEVISTSRVDMKLRNSNKISIIYLVGIVLLAFASCDLSNLGLNRSRQYSIVSPEDDIANIPTEDFFYVNIKSAYYTGGQGSFDPLDFMLYAMDEGPGTDCKISVNEEAGTEDLYCMLDVAEGDLWYHEINLEYNIPPGMCKYLGFTPHWHYNQEVGEGPLAVIKTTSTSGGETTTTYSPCVQANIEINHECQRRAREIAGDIDTDWNDADNAWGSSGIPADYSCGNAPTTHCIDTKGTPATDDDDEVQYTDGTNPVAEASATYQYRCEKVINTGSCSRGKHHSGKEEVEEVCYYNKSHIEGKGNCCLGVYTVWNAEDGSSEEEREWDGDVQNCIGGLGRLNWTYFNNSGFPVTLVKETGSRGLNEDYKLDPLIQKIQTRVSFPIANYFEGVEDKAGEDGENFPDFYKNANSCGETPSGAKIPCFTGHPYLTWTCLDGNQEVLHQINFIIREWNSQEEFARFKESSGGRGDPDIAGEEGSECENYSPEENFQAQRVFSHCNDILDADDKTKDSARWRAYGLGSGQNDYPEINYEGGSGS